MSPLRPGDPVTVVLNLHLMVWNEQRVVLRRTWWNTGVRAHLWPWGTARLPRELEGIVWIRGHHRNTSKEAKALLVAYWLREHELHAHR